MDPNELKVGDRLDVWDKFDLWFPAEIVVKTDTQMIVHYPNWPSTFDEIIALEETDNKKGIRYAPIHTKTCKFIHIESICPLSFDFHARTESMSNQKISMIAHGTNENPNIMMYGCNSNEFYQFDANKHKYSSPNAISLDAEYELLDVAIKDKLYFVNFHKSMCYQKDLDSDNWKSIRMNIPWLKSYVLSNCPYADNEWYLIGRPFEESCNSKQQNMDDMNERLQLINNEIVQLQRMLRSLNLHMYGTSVEQQSIFSSQYVDKIRECCTAKLHKCVETKHKLEQKMRFEEVKDYRIMRIRLDASKGFVVLLNERIAVNNASLVLSEYNKVFYVPFKHRLMMMTTGDVILFMDLCDDVYKWEQYTLKMPYAKRKNEDDWCCHLVFGSLLFVIYFMPNCHQEIWCLDLLSNAWFKCDKKYSPYCYKDQWPFTIKTMDNYLHSVSIGDYKSHTKIAFIDLVPRVLKKQYFDYFYQTSVMKNIVKYQKEYQLMIPKDLVALVMNYYPLFL